MRTLLLTIAIAAPLAVAGMGAAVHGRLGLRREGDRYRGSAWAWMGYLGGILLVAFSLVAIGCGAYAGLTA